MAEMAERFERSIKSFQAEAGTSKTTFIFKDGSRLNFDASPSSIPQTIGAQGSDAQQFASSLEFFTTTVDGIEFTFQDGSRLAYNLKGAATTKL